MKKTSSGVFGRLSRQGCMAAFISLFMVVFAGTAVFANAVNIYDNANILNQSSVKRAASALSKPVDIYTVNSSMSNATFDQTAKNYVRRNANLIVLAFDNQHVSIVGGSNVPLSTSQYQDAVNAFTGTIRNSNRNYTNATVSALNSLQGSLQGSQNSRGGLAPGAGGGRSGGIFNGTFCCIGLLVLLLIAAFAFTRFRRRGARFNQPYGASDYSQNPSYRGGNYPPNQYYQDPNTQPNQGGMNPSNQYYQGPNTQPNRGGMNPLAAGGLGAALGGLFGYGLGKESDRDRNAGGEGGVGGGAGASGDFGNSGSGASGDFGNSGGGASGDFGNSGDGGFGGDSDSGEEDDGGGFGGGAGGNF